MSLAGTFVLHNVPVHAVCHLQVSTALRGGKSQQPGSARHPAANGSATPTANGQSQLPAPRLGEGAEQALLYVRFRAAAEPGLSGTLAQCILLMSETCNFAHSFTHSSWTRTGHCLTIACHRPPCLLPQRKLDLIVKVLASMLAMLQASHAESLVPSPSGSLQGCSRALRAGLNWPQSTRSCWQTASRSTATRVCCWWCLWCSSTSLTPLRSPCPRSCGKAAPTSFRSVSPGLALSDLSRGLLLPSAHGA